MTTRGGMNMLPHCVQTSVVDLGPSCSGLSFRKKPSCMCRRECPSKSFGEGVAARCCRSGGASLASGIAGSDWQELLSICGAKASVVSRRRRRFTRFRGQSFWLLFLVSGRAPYLQSRLSRLQAALTDTCKILQHERLMCTFAKYSSGNATNFIQDMTSSHNLPTDNCSTAIPRTCTLWKVPGVSSIE